MSHPHQSGQPGVPPTGVGMPNGMAQMGMGFPPMMMQPGAPMTPMMMQQQMMQMQQQFQQMMQMQQALQQQQQQAGGQPNAAAVPIPMPFPMMNMPGMMQPPMFPMGMMPGFPTMPNMIAPQTGVAPPVAAAAAPTTPVAAVPGPAASPAPIQHTVAPLPTPSPPVAQQQQPAMPPMPLSQFPIGIPPIMMPGFSLPPMSQPDPVWNVSKAAPVVVTPVAAPAVPPKADVFGDLSNPNLALRKERFVIEQTKTKSAPPPSAGVRAEDDEEEDFADFASADAGKKDDDFTFDEPVSGNVQQPSSSPIGLANVSFDSSPHQPSSSPVEPLPQPTLSADALMTKAFDMFEHHKNAPLVAQVSMSQIASHQGKHAHAHAHAQTQPSKARRDMPQDLDDLLSNLVGPDATATPVALPTLGNVPAPATTVAKPDFDDDEDFGDFESTAAVQATQGIQQQTQVHPPVVPPTAAVENGDEEEDEDGFGDFTSHAATSAPMPPVVTSSFQPPGSSFQSPPPPTSIPDWNNIGGAVPNSSFNMLATSSFTVPTTTFMPPVSSFVPPAAPVPANSSVSVEAEEEEEEFADFASSSPAPVQEHQHPVKPHATNVSVEEEEEEDEDGFADFSRGGTATHAAAASTTHASSDPFGDLGANERAEDATLGTLSPEQVTQPPLQTTAAVEDAQDAEEEEFADFSSAPSAVEFVVPTASDEPPAVAEVVPSEPEKPKQESDLIGDWGAPSAGAAPKKKANPFAVESPPATSSDDISFPPASAVVEPTPSPPLNLDDVFGGLISPDENQTAPPVLPDLLPGLPLNTSGASSSGSNKSRSSISGALAAVASLPKPLASVPSSAEHEDDDEDGFGSFAGSGSDGSVNAAASMSAGHSFVPSQSFDSLALQSSPPSIVASPAPPQAFAFSQVAEEMTVPSSVQVQSRVPRGIEVALRADDSEAPADGEAAFAMLIKQERFLEAKACLSFKNASSDLASLQKTYKAALAAAEDDDDEAKLAEAMKLQKQIKQLKGLKPEENWMRNLTPEEQRNAPASWTQIRSTLTSLDPEWEMFFSSIYPEPFLMVAQEQSLDAAIAQQSEANRLLKSVLGPSTNERPSHTARLTKLVEFISSQLTIGQAFMHETSHLDLTDATKQAEFTALLAAPDSRTITFLTGLVRLYRVLVQVEFSNALFDLDVSSDSIQEAHSSWLQIMKYAHSSPLQSYLGVWLESNAIDIDAERQKLNAGNSVESLSEHRGRHSCAICSTNQHEDGMHSVCTALQARLSSELSS